MQAMNAPRIEAGWERSVRVLEVVGEIDMYSSKELAKALVDASGGLVVDLGGVSFIDSSGVQTLVAEQQRRAVEGGRLVLVCVPGGILRRVLEVTETAVLFETYASRAEAVDAVASEP